jgi:hypothetical protein
MTSDLTIPARFNGPARSATVEVTLRRPPPLDAAMTVATGADVTTLTHDGETVAQARLVDGALDPAEPVDPDVAAEAMLGYPGRSGHPFPTCFACGPDRAEGDGLRIFPGPVGGDRGHVASLWVPAESHTGLAVAWAALDCVGGWSEDLEGRPCVLGRMTARVDALPDVGAPHVVVGRHLATDGRKSHTASTLYDSDGRILALARHTWIQVDPSAFN